MILEFISFTNKHREGFLQSGHIASLGFRNDYNVGATIMKKSPFQLFLISDTYACKEMIIVIKRADSGS